MSVRHSRISGVSSSKKIRCQLVILARKERKSGVSSSFLPEKMNRHRIARDTGLRASAPDCAHHLEHRVESHIFLCVLAYHLLVAIETTLQRQEIHTSWATVRD
ncbi:MAG: hypothetical protein WB773_13610, partial [Isosphaeraceae bacterium]